jgi:rubrerythrin
MIREWLLQLIGYRKSCYKCGNSYRNDADPAIRVCPSCEAEIRSFHHQMTISGATWPVGK